jgi:hypothetical protein
MSFESNLAAAAATAATAAVPQRRRRKQQHGTPSSRRQSAAYESDANCSGTDTSCCDSAVVKAAAYNSNSSMLGYGAALYSKGYTELAGVLAALQLPPDDVTVMYDTVIGRGKFATVYKAQHDSQVCAAKVSVCCCYIISVTCTRVYSV